jgi:hypothetical protein
MKSLFIEGLVLSNSKLTLKMNILATRWRNTLSGSGVVGSHPLLKKATPVPNMRSFKAILSKKAWNFDILLETFKEKSFIREFFCINHLGTSLPPIMPNF